MKQVFLAIVLPIVFVACGSKSWKSQESKLVTIFASNYTDIYNPLTVARITTCRAKAAVDLLDKLGCKVVELDNPTITQLRDAMKCTESPIIEALAEEQKVACETKYKIFGHE
jgi:ABC-type Fe3+-hydroxamate transport system substrate-binding protein